MVPCKTHYYPDETDTKKLRDKIGKDQIADAAVTVKKSVISAGEEEEQSGITNQNIIIITESSAETRFEGVVTEEEPEDIKQRNDNYQVQYFDSSNCESFFVVLICIHEKPLPRSGIKNDE